MHYTKLNDKETETVKDELIHIFAILSASFLGKGTYAAIGGGFVRDILYNIYNNIYSTYIRDIDIYISNINSFEYIINIIKSNKYSIYNIYDPSIHYSYSPYSNKRISKYFFLESNVIKDLKYELNIIYIDPIHSLHTKTDEFGRMTEKDHISSLLCDMDVSSSQCIIPLSSNIDILYTANKFLDSFCKNTQVLMKENTPLKYLQKLSTYFHNELILNFVPDEDYITHTNNSIEIHNDKFWESFSKLNLIFIGEET